MTFVRRRLAVLPTLSLLIATVLGLTVLTGGPGVGAALADQPIQMPNQVVDAADVLSGEQEAEIGAAIDELAADRNVQLWVVYVRNFDGKSPQDWARETEQQSELSYRDILLAINVDDRSFFFDSAEPIDDYPAEDLRKIADDTIAPDVAEAKWTDAALDTASALDTAGSRMWIYLSVAGLAALALIAAAYLVLRNRRRTLATGDEVSSEDSALTVEELTTQPITTLNPWASELLTHTDNAVSISDDELALATAEFGDTATAAFHGALTTAESALATSFRLRHTFDEEPELSNGERRSLLVQIISMCSDANQALDEQVRPFDTLRDLVDGADARLDALADRCDALAERLDQAEASEAYLAESFSTAVAESVIGNSALARELIHFAQDSIAQGREAVADEADLRLPTAAAIRSAEGGVDTAAKLLDAISDVSQNVVLIAEKSTALAYATAHVGAAESLIDTRRGAVGTPARTSLSEAERLLDRAQSTADEHAADKLADQATALADQALTLARQDVLLWKQQNPHDGAAVLTGVLVDAVINEATGDGGFGNGGFSSGGRSPASFGGSDTSGRLGTGGRS
ncbi:TPM domain-containing protein [Gordonia alkaliphila]|uniref:TPM domain-containing protein n=1 Tax=Gordonia alkaliphila TaxID=1053547 RepID=UPI001FF4A210|nr:TPM domain-containing protein [Gordonia alkaliphila]MCK0438989.1 TPM domain-containing protein [Gordonia alkaliphila]